jgi:uncharacterized cupin superfamily protein
MAKGRHDLQARAALLVVLTRAASGDTRAMNAKVIDFSSPLAGDASTPATDKLIAGDPRQTISNYFSDSTGQFHAGRWSSTRGKWRIRYSESEFCCLTKGRVALENNAGERWEFGPGQAFVVPSGFEGSWEVIEECTKFYAIFEART